jgi:hypothetical protein
MRKSYQEFLLILKMIVKPNTAYGTYHVGNNVYVNKIDALAESTKTKLPVEYKFYDDVYTKYNWCLRPQGSLPELYRQRAQQIRDSYDYVVVHFSGGADSWTALHSFLSNGIHVDEVYTRWPFAERKYTPADPTSRHDSNLTSEFEYAVVPVLDDISKRFPNTLIYIDDYSEEYEKDFRENNLANSSHYMAMGTFFRFSRKSPQEISAAKNNKRIVVVQGFEKTPVYIHDGEFYAYFMDRYGAADPDPERTTEGFFWSPMMPEIAIAQAHELKYYYETSASQDEITAIMQIADKSTTPRETYIKVCYPHYNLGTFQVGKPLGSIAQRHDFWVRKHNPRYFESWKWHIDQLINPVNPDYLRTYKDTNVVLGIKTMKTCSYSLGKFKKHNSLISS